MDCLTASECVAELIADRGADEVGAVGVEALAHQQIDMAKIDVSEIDRDFLGLWRLFSQFVDVPHSHPSTICLDGIWMVDVVGCK